MTFVSMILSVIVIGGLILYMRSQHVADNAHTHASDDSFVPNPDSQQAVLDPEFVRTHWAEIQAMMKIGGAGMKNALIEADKLLDYVMKTRGFAGEDMGGRLKLNGDKFSDLNGVWSAHKLRNQYAHDVHIDVVPREVERAVAQLGQAIRDLGVPV